MESPPIISMSFRCNICLKKLEQLWFRCLRCFNIKVCSTCFENGRDCLHLHHFQYHPMQVVIAHEPGDLAYFNNAKLSCFGSYTCPYCGRAGFTASRLQVHIEEYHRDDQEFVKCPICVSIPENEDRQLYQNLLQHIANYNISGSNNSFSEFHIDPFSPPISISPESGESNNLLLNIEDPPPDEQALFDFLFKDD